MQVSAGCVHVVVSKTYFAPDVRRVLVDQRLCRVAEEKLGHDEETNLLFAVQRLLEYMAPVAVGSQLDDATPTSLRMSRGPSA